MRTSAGKQITNPVPTTAQKDSPIPKNKFKLLRMCRIYKKSGNFRKEICRCDTQSENHGKKPVFSICFVFEMTWDETEYHKAM